MSTTALQCPKCRAWLRVAVQPSSIMVRSEVKDATVIRQLLVDFHPQIVAHECNQ